MLTDAPFGSEHIFMKIKRNLKKTKKLSAQHTHTFTPVPNKEVTFSIFYSQSLLSIPYLNKTNETMQSQITEW